MTPPIETGRGARGHILVHVLITAVIVSVIMAGIARMLMTRYGVYARAQQTAQNTRTATSAVDRLLTVWASIGIACYDPASDARYSSVGYRCSGSAGNTTSPPGPNPPDCKCCPADTLNDAALTFVSGGGVTRLCVETPNGNGGYTADNTANLAPGCPSISCP